MRRIGIALIQAGTTPGKIAVKATAFGLEPDRVVIESQPLREKTL